MADYVSSHRSKTDTVQVVHALAVVVPSQRFFNAIGGAIDIDEPFVPGLPTQYRQRVWDAGTVGWCYYVKDVIDPTPLAGETSPNYTGAISAHSVIEEF